jgi:hypothetical protein
MASEPVFGLWQSKTVGDTGATTTNAPGTKFALDQLYANIIAAFTQAESALVGPNLFLDLAHTDVDMGETGYQGKKVTINFPNSDFQVREVNVGDSVEYDSPETLTRDLELKYHPTMAFPIYDLEKAFSARPAQLREMFVDEAIKSFGSYMNRKVANIFRPAASGVEGFEIINPTTASGTPKLDVKDFAKGWAKLVTNKCPVRDFGNVNLVVHPEVYQYFLTDDNWALASAVGYEIAGSIRRSAMVGQVFGVISDYDLDTQIAYNAPGEIPSGDTSNNVVDTANVAAGKKAYRSFLFHKRAIAIAYRPLELPGPESGVRASMATYKGVPIRFMLTYNRQKFRWEITFDSLYGYMVYRPEFGVIFQSDALTV